jgi:hypothetical protein
MYLFVLFDLLLRLYILTTDHCPLLLFAVLLIFVNKILETTFLIVGFLCKLHIIIYMYLSRRKMALAIRAKEGTLTVEEVNAATKEKLEDDKYGGGTVLWWATAHCPVEVIEAILNKGVNIDGFCVSVVVMCFNIKY